MADSATTRNRFRKQEVGAKTNAWGTDWNEDGGSDRLDEALDGVVSFTGTKTLTSVNYETDEARRRVLNVTGGSGGTVTIPAVEKNYLVRNASSGDVTISNGSNSVIVKSGNITAVFTDATNVYQARVLDYGSDLLSSSGTPSSGNHLVNKTYADGLAFSSSLPGQSGNSGKFLGTDGTTASWTLVSLTAAVSGTLPASNGGTGQSSYTTGDILYASGTTALSKLAATAAGNVLLSGSAPSWGKVTLTTHVTGTLPAGNGGTGLTSLGTGVATFLGTPSSANLRGALTDETGTGAAVFATSPTFTGPPVMPASGNSNASLNIPSGTAPTSPAEGDIWREDSGVRRGLYYYSNGTTYGPLIPLATLGSGQSVSGVSAVTFTSIPATFAFLIIRISGVSSSLPGALTLELSSDNGSNWSNAITLSSPAAADTVYGAITIAGYTVGALQVVSRIKSITTATTLAAADSTDWAGRIGVVNAVRISVTGTGDAGTITVYGA